MLEYVHTDVFSPVPYSGNSLAVFADAGHLSTAQMLRITQELRHFESIFLEPISSHRVRARVFDLFEEMPFAGHPIIGAAAVLHRQSGLQGAQTWQIDLPSKTVSITTEPTSSGYFGLLDQGQPEFVATVNNRATFARAFNLEPEDLHPTLPLEIVSTGLRYLIVPVQPGALERARIRQDITALLHSVQAEFSVMFDESKPEARHWNNDGIIEDVATGSAAGPIGAYRLKHGLVRANQTFVLNQGRFVGRPTRLHVHPEGSSTHVTTVKVGGDVTVIGHGSLEVLP